MSSPMEEALQWLSQPPQNQLLCCFSEIFLPPRGRIICDRDSTARFINAMLDPRLARYLLPSSEFPRHSNRVIEVERRLQVGGETVRQARYFVLLDPVLENGRPAVKYVEIHAKDVYEGRNPTMVKVEMRTGHPAVLCPEMVDWKACAAHQPRGGTLSRVVTLLWLRRPVRYRTEVTGEWLKSGMVDDWGTL